MSRIATTIRRNPLKAAAVAGVLVAGGAVMFARARQAGVGDAALEQLRTLKAKMTKAARAGWARYVLGGGNGANGGRKPSMSSAKFPSPQWSGRRFAEKAPGTAWVPTQKEARVMEMTERAAGLNSPVFDFDLDSHRTLQRAIQANHLIKNGLISRSKGLQYVKNPNMYPNAFKMQTNKLGTGLQLRR